MSLGNVNLAITRLLSLIRSIGIILSICWILCQGRFPEFPTSRKCVFLNFVKSITLVYTECNPYLWFFSHIFTSRFLSEKRTALCPHISQRTKSCGFLHYVPAIFSVTYQKSRWIATAAIGIATIVLSRKHTSSSQNLIGDLVASMTVAVSEKKMICTMETRHTNTRAW